MPTIIRPTSKVKIVPKEGEIEITLNINISVDGKVVASSEEADVSVQQVEEKVPHMIPDFFSGMKLNFGKQEGS